MNPSSEPLMAFNFFKVYGRFLCFILFSLWFPLLGYADNSGVSIQDTSNGALFTPSAADQSIMYLGELFGSVPPVLAGTGSSLMSELFSTFNSIVMAFGIVIAGYTTFVGILNTAGEGEMLGKGWNSIWVPIKTVAGIALLIPTASGYCVCQIFMMWILVQGIGAADSLTNIIVDYMKKGQQIFVSGSTGGASGETSSATQYANTPIKTILAGLTCMQYYRKQNLDAGLSTDIYTIPTPKTSSSVPNAVEYTFPICVNNSSQQTADKGCPIGATYSDCGTITVTAPKNDNSSLASLAYIEQGLAAIMPSLNSVAYFMVNDAATDKSTVMQDTYNFVGADFLTEVENTYHSYVVQANNAISVEGDGYGSFYDDIKSYGWVSLGDLYWNMAKSNGDTGKSGANQVAKAIPESGGNPTGYSWSSTKNISVAYTKESDMYYDYDAYKYAGSNYIDASGTSHTGYSDNFMTDLVDAQQQSGSSGKGFNAEGNDSYSEQLKGTSAIAAMTMDVLDNMINAFKSDTNPLVTAQRLGHNISLDTEAILTTFASIITVASIGAGFMACELPTFLTFQTLLAFTVPSVMAFGAILMVLGGTLAIVIPFIPALVYFLAVIAWLIAALETIIAAPIVAVGIIHPDGQHPVWGKAEPAIMLMVNMFLRPSLIVLGLAAGVLLSFITVQFINFTFEVAMYNIVESTPTSVEATLLLTTYVGLIMACVNKSFSVIDLLPNQVMRWIGAEGTRFEGGGDALQKLQSGQEGQGSKSGEGGAQRAEGLSGAGSKAMSDTGQHDERNKNNMDQKLKAQTANKASSMASMLKKK